MPSGKPFSGEDWTLNDLTPSIGNLGLNRMAA